MLYTVAVRIEGATHNFLFRQPNNLQKRSKEVRAARQDGLLLKRPSGAIYHLVSRAMFLDADEGDFLELA